MDVLPPEELRRLLEAEPIRDDELMRIRVEREAVEELARQLKAANEVLTHHEAEVVARLKRGAVVESTLFIARIDQEPGRCSPKWKDEHLNHMVECHGADKKVEEGKVRLKYPAGSTDFLVVEPIPQKVT